MWAKKYYKWLKKNTTEFILGGIANESEKPLCMNCQHLNKKRT